MCIKCVFHSADFFFQVGTISTEPCDLCAFSEKSSSPLFNIHWILYLLVLVTTVLSCVSLLIQVNNYHSRMSRSRNGEIEMTRVRREGKCFTVFMCFYSARINPRLLSHSHFKIWHITNKHQRKNVSSGTCISVC